MPTCLSLYAQEQAAWRRVKAEEYPDDPRNLKAALNFEQWAGWLDALPQDHPYNKALDAINRDLGEYEWSPNADTQAWLSPAFFHSRDEMDFDALTADVIAEELAAQSEEAAAQSEEAPTPETKAEKKMAMTYDRLAELNAAAMEATARHNVRTEGMAMKRPSPRTFREATRSFNAHTRLTDVMGKHGLITDADDGDDGQNTKKGKKKGE